MEKKTDKDNKKKIIIAIILLVLLLLAGVGIYFLMEKNKKNDTNTTTTTTTEVVVETITISFDVDGGTKLQDITINKGSTTELPSTSKEGYTFTGWYLKDKTTEVNSEYVYNEDTKVYALFKKIDKQTKTMKIKFDSNGGSKVSSITLECSNDSVTIKSFPKNPTKKGYTFRAWEDKWGKAILKGAKLTCEDLTLYAAWDEEEEKVEPYCPTGYTLNADKTKCTMEGKVIESCPSGTKADGNLCIKTTDSNAGTPECRVATVQTSKSHTESVKGDYYVDVFGRCAYYKWTNITTKSQCDAAYDKNTVWVNRLNACYAKTIDNNFDIVCASDYQYYSSSELSSKFGINDNAKCLKKVEKTKSCESGFDLTNGKCVQTINARGL